MNMKNCKDEGRMTFRLSPKLKDWVSDKGGSAFLRRLLLIAYENLEKKKFRDDEL